MTSDQEKAIIVAAGSVLRAIELLAKPGAASGSYGVALEDALRERDEARAECKRLKRERLDFRLQEECDMWRRQCDEARAERDELYAARKAMSSIGVSAGSLPPLITSVLGQLQDARTDRDRLAAELREAREERDRLRATNDAAYAVLCAPARVLGLPSVEELEKLIWSGPGPESLKQIAVRLHAALSALAPVQEPQAIDVTWRPMNTAPKDGTPVLVAFAGDVGVRQVTWEHGLWRVDDNKHGPFPLRGYSEGDELGWMSLPQFPSPDAATGKGGGE